MILLLHNSILYIFQPYAEQTADITRKAALASAATWTPRQGTSASFLSESTGTKLSNQWALKVTQLLFSFTITPAWLPQPSCSLCCPTDLGKVLLKLTSNKIFLNHSTPFGPTVFQNWFIPEEETGTNCPPGCLRLQFVLLLFSGLLVFCW